jgi:hypothetical protein
MKSAFDVRIASTANQLVGNYSVPEHHVCTTHLRHDHLNGVFDLAPVKYHLHPEPTVRVVKKCQDSAVAVAPAPLKMTPLE